MFHEPLTDRENTILHLIARGFSNQEIADDLVISLGTVKWYNRQIYHKLGVRSRTQAVRMAQQRQLLPVQPHTETPRHNLPAPVTSFIGREREITEVKQMLQEARLVTLTGPGGIGKSRLAQQAVKELAGDLVDNIWLVALGCTEDPTLVSDVIAKVMGLGETNALPQMLKNVLADQSTLLVIDNFEHLMPAAPLLADLLAAVQGLRLLVTSREVLHLSGEHVYPVPPLELPCAVSLFVQRAQAVRVDLQSDSLGTVNAICERLDRMPLAIELAAARARILTPQALLTQLGNCPLLIGEGPRDWPGHHHTLYATIDWSYNLLSPDEQLLFEQLAVFHGGCTVEAAEAICDPGFEVLDSLSSLYDKSLIQTEKGSDGETRFIMLSTIHAYAATHLKMRPDLTILQQRFTQYYLDMIARARVSQPVWLQRLSAEYDNLRAIMEHSFGSQGDRGSQGAEIVAGLGEFWYLTGHLAEGHLWLQTAQSFSNDLSADLQMRLENVAVRLAVSS